MREHGLGFEIEEFGPPSRGGRIFVAVFVSLMVVPVLVLTLCQDWSDTAPVEPRPADDTAPAAAPLHEDSPAERAAERAAEPTRVRARSGATAGTPLQRRQRAGSEEAFEAEFRLLASSDRNALVSELRGGMRERPVAACVAALRVSHELRIGAPFEYFLAAATNDPREVLRDFALRFIIERARESDARIMLTRFLDKNPEAERHRTEATYALLRWAEVGEIQGAVSRLFAESAQGVVTGGVRALMDHGGAAARGALLDLQYRHPSREVRDAVAALVGGR